jgi:regulatory protein
MLARQRAGQGYGERRIRHDLRERGIENTLIDEALAELDVDWFDLARQQAVRRYGDGPPADARERARRMRHLLGRGFGYDEVNHALSAPDD